MPRKHIQSLSTRAVRHLQVKRGKIPSHLLKGVTEEVPQRMLVGVSCHWGHWPGEHLFWAQKLHSWALSRETTAPRGLLPECAEQLNSQQQGAEVAQMCLEREWMGSRGVWCRGIVLGRERGTLSGRSHTQRAPGTVSVEA